MKPSNRRRMAALVMAGGIAFANSDARAGGVVEIEFDLASFSTPLLIDNPYWALTPGRHIVYWEVSDDECIVNDFVVTGSIKAFAGAYAGLQGRVISDREWLDADCDGGRDVLLEDTADWYAQDDAGNIWYLGEDTTEFLFDDDGNPAGFSKEGSWEAGVDGAVAGLIMLARPESGLRYQQEYYADVAEDMALVLRTNVQVSIGLGDYGGCLETKEWTPLEPGEIEHKTYCPLLGLVRIEGLHGKTVVTEAVDLGL